MKKVFISYRFTGENHVKLRETISQIHDSIGKAGYNHYSTIFDSEQFDNEKWSGKQIMNRAFAEIDGSDLILFFVKSPEISQGMLVELGYAIANKKKIILAIQKDIEDIIFRRQIKEIIEFKDIEDLKEKLCKLKF